MLVEQLTTFCLLFSLYLSTLHDAEFYHEMKGMPCCGQTCRPDVWLADVCLSSAGSFMPFSLPQLAAMIQVLRDVFVSLHLQRPLRLPSTQPTSLDWNCLKQVSGGCSLVPRPHGGVKAWLRGHGGVKAWLRGYGRVKAWLRGYGRVKPWLRGYGRVKAWLRGYGGCCCTTELFLQYIHRLLCALYERDCRRPFCSPGHWEALHMQQIPPELFMESSEGRGALQ